MNLMELKQDREAALQKAESIITTAEMAGRALTTQEQKDCDAAMAEVNALQPQIDNIERQNTLSKVLRANGGRLLPGNPSGEGRPGTETWKDERGKSIPVLKNNQSFAAAVQTGPPPSFSFGEFVKSMVLPSGNPAIMAGLAESGGVAGGDVTVPTFLAGGLIDLMRAKTVCIQAGAVTVPLETETTNMVRIAADPTPTWRTEASAVTSAVPTFERVQFLPKSLAVIVKVSQEILEDAVNLDQIIMDIFAKSFAVELDRVGLFGTGTAPQPHGIAGTTNVGNVSMGTNGAALTNYDPFVNAVSALLTANAQMPTAAIMSPRTLTKAALLKDTLGQPQRRPDLIQNLPFLATTAVPNTQTQGTSSVASESIVGDFSKLMFGIRTSLRIRILQERFLGDTLEYGFLAFLRADVQLAHPQSFCEVVGIL
jgi:HK97 family phage major capsid protein